MSVYLMGCGCSQAEKDTWAPPTKERLTISNLEDLVITPGAFILENCESFHSVYEVTERFLGKGNFTEVRECVHIRSGVHRAVKIIHKSGVSKRVLNGRLLLREVDVLKHLSHPNIVRVFEFFEDLLHYYIVMELCSGCELFDLVLQSTHLDETKAARILEQLLSAVSYCHSLSIVHRDLKPENIMVEDRAGEAFVTLIDFDSATFFAVSHEVHGAYGTVFYMAPEVIQGDYTEKCDVWSIGVIMYVLLSGRPPFWGYTDRVIRAAILHDPFTMAGKDWLCVSDSAKDLICKMLTKDPRRRISAAEAYMHPWIQDHSPRHQTNLKFASEVCQSIRDFHSVNKLRAAVRTFIISQVIDSHDFAELREMFTSLDRNGDGLISQSDLIQLFKHVMSPGEAETEAKAVVTELSPRDDELIDYNMFLAATADRRKIMSEENLRSAFALFDQKGTGTIRCEELREMMSAGNLLEDSVWHGVIHDLDSDGKGEISLSQFVSVMGRSLSREEEEEISLSPPFSSVQKEGITE